MRATLVGAAGAVAVSYGAYWALTVRPWDASHQLRAAVRADVPAAGMYPATLVNGDGLWLYWRRWPAEGKARGVVVLCHGLGEHIGRYEHVVAALARRGLTVYAMDHQGHGQSEGERQHAREWADLVDDQLLFVDRVVKAREGASVRPFLVGHSMGGCIAAHLALRRPELWRGVVLSGAALMLDPKVAPPWLIAVGTFVSGYLPKVRIPGLDKIVLSHDPQVERKYFNDPLVYTGLMSVRFAAGLIAHVAEAAARAGELTAPLLVLHGEADVMALAEGSVRAHAAARSADKRLVVYPGLDHEIFNELEGRDDVGENRPVRDAADWIAARL